MSSIRAYKKQRIISGWKWDLFSVKLNIKNLFRLIFWYKSPLKAIRVIKKVRKQIAHIAGKKAVTKAALVNDTYFARAHMPGLDTAIYKRYLKSEMNSHAQLDEPVSRLASAFVAITKKCPLACEHCSEWKNLNQPEKLTSTDIRTVVNHLLEIGTIRIDFTGGEPMLRIKDILPVIASSSHLSNFWILTSGFNFTAKNAQKLKIAGLTGVMVSLDHYKPELHDRFRGYQGSFEKALYAVKHSIENDLVTVISVCLTQEKANPEFMMKYMELAKDLGVAFVQFLEPKPVGNYEGKAVVLSSEDIQIIENFLVRMNYDHAFRDYPIIISHGYYQRRIGCLASGKKAIFVDTNGDIHGCPFCHRKSGSMLEDNYAEAIDLLASRGCAIVDIPTVEEIESHQLSNTRQPILTK